MLKIDSLQKRVGVLIAVVGTLVIVTNFMENIQDGYTFLESIEQINVWVNFLLFLPGYVSVFFENRYIKFIQVAGILLTGTMNVLTEYNQVYGPSLFFIGWLLMRQYGYFERHKRLKYAFFIGFLIICVQISAYIHNKTVFLLANELFQFSLFMIFFILAVWKDIFDRDEKLSRENQALKANYNKIAEELGEIERDSKPYDLKGAGITPAEERVLKILVLYKASNKEIAERLNISEHTVKLHMYNIFNKLGVDSRFTVIELCKYNYTVFD